MERTSPFCEEEGKKKRKGLEEVRWNAILGNYMEDKNTICALEKP